MAFEPQNALEAALAKAVTDPLARPDFYRLLMESDLVVLGRKSGEPPSFNIATMRHNGREFLPVFSALQRLTAFAGEGRDHFTIDGRTLFETTRGAHVALNPNCECGKVLMAPEIAYWLDPSARARRRLKDAEVRIAEPAAPPRKLIEALRLFFANRGSVQTAYLLEATPLDGSEPPHPLIGIETQDDWMKIAREVSELAAAIAPETIIDLVSVDPRQPSDGVAARLTQTLPFYRKSATPN